MRVALDGVQDANFDANMVTRLAENLSGVELEFENIHPRRYLQPLAWFSIKCPPGMCVQLPHSYYRVTGKQSELRIAWHYGRAMHRVKRLSPEKIAYQI